MLCCAFPAAARNARLDLPVGSLSDGIRRIAAATGSEIVSVEPGLADVRLRGQQLDGGTAHMLEMALRGTSYRAVRVGTDSFRIERRPPPPLPRRRPLPVLAPRGQDIIVTASKFPVPLQQYPGSVMHALVMDPAHLAGQSEDMDRAASRLPVLQQTQLGEGRNKLFIRGIADSSFNGATQPTASIYFGDALLGFGSPSPSLRLYDIASVEVLEGPQGTLYGSGSLGGVIRIAPNPVDLSHFGGNAVLGASVTQDGGPGWDSAGMVNVPLVDGHLGIRAVGYHQREGGYIDNAAVGDDSNGATVDGARGALSARIPGGISIEAGGLYQETNGLDGQYVNGDPRTLTRFARIAEPYASKLKLGYGSIEKAWDSGLKLTAVASFGDRSSYDKFDSTPPGMRPVAYQLARASTLVAYEGRLSRRNDAGLSWVVGASYQRVRDGQTRSLGIPDEPAELDEVTNITITQSLFGQASFSLLRGVEATLGLRWTVARTDSEPSRDAVSLIRGVTARRADPTVALAWHVAPRTLLYTRLQTGYRNGGMAVARGVGRVANFDSDSVTMAEVGIRRLRSGPRGLSASVALSYTRWDDIQADLITRRGLPYTANIGDARVLAVEAAADWVPLTGLTIGGALFYTDSSLSGELASQSAPQNRMLPETPAWSGVVHGDYGWGERVRWRVGGTARYVGRSILGPGSLLDVSQGEYVVADAALGARRGAVDLSLSVDNLFDARANRFSFGNPITYYNRDQRVPLRPRTLRVAVGFSW